MPTNHRRPLSAYTQFWIRFNNACKGNTIFPKNFPLIEDTNQSNNVCAVICSPKAIHLKGWKTSKGRIKKVDILINAQEAIRKSDLQIIKSTVHVSYFEVSDTKVLKLIESIHYDFDDKYEKGHPYCHVQFCPDPVNPSRVESFSGYDTRNCVWNGSRLEGLRIPTAHMNLISVLISLVADHINEPMLQQLIKETKNIPNMPTIDSEGLFSDIHHVGHNFRSCHWYSCQ